MRCSIVFVLLATGCLAGVLRDNVKYYFHKKYLIGERQGTVYSVKIPNGGRDDASYLLGTIILYDAYAKGPDNANSISIGDIEINKKEPDCDEIEDKGNIEDDDKEIAETNTSAEGGENNNSVENNDKEIEKNDNRERERDKNDRHKHHNDRSHGRNKKGKSSKENNSNESS